MLNKNIKGWRIYDQVSGKLLDIVFFDATMSAEEVEAAERENFLVAIKVLPDRGI